MEHIQNFHVFNAPRDFSGLGHLGADTFASRVRSQRYWAAAKIGPGMSESAEAVARFGWLLFLFPGIAGVCDARTSTI
jgi:hypothetical protein